MAPLPHLLKRDTTTDAAVAMMSAISNVIYNPYILALLFAAIVASLYYYRTRICEYTSLKPSFHIN